MAQGERSRPKELRKLVPGLGTGGKRERKEVAGHRTEGDSKLQDIKTETQNPPS